MIGDPGLDDWRSSIIFLSISKGLMLANFSELNPFSYYHNAVYISRDLVTWQHFTASYFTPQYFSLYFFTTITNTLLLRYSYATATLRCHYCYAAVTAAYVAQWSA